MHLRKSLSKKTGTKFLYEEIAMSKKAAKSQVIYTLFHLEGMMSDLFYFWLSYVKINVIFSHKQKKLPN